MMSRKPLVPGTLNSSGHWEKYFNHMVGKYNRMHKVQLPARHMCVDIHIVQIWREQG